MEKHSIYGNGVNLRLKQQALLMLVEALCTTNRDIRHVSLRRYNGSFRALKLVRILKRVDPVIYHELFNHVNCYHGDDVCLGKTLYGYMRVMFKSVINEINTIGDICEKIQPRLRRLVQQYV